MSHIYFARCGSHIKIGIAVDVERRLSSLRVGSAAPVILLASVVGDKHLERKLHKRLGEHRVQGEWFLDCPDVQTTIAECVATLDVGEQFATSTRKINSKFGAVARLLWPNKTAATLAAMAGVSERTAERWLSGEIAPPYEIIEAVMHETFKRD